MHRLYTCTWFGIYIHLIIHCVRGKCRWMIPWNHFYLCGPTITVSQNFPKTWGGNLVVRLISINMKQLLMYTYVGMYIRGQEYIVIRSHKWELFSDIKKSLSLTINFKCACVYEERSPVRRIRTNHKADRFTCQSMYCLQKESFELKSNQCKIKS